MARVLTYIDPTFARQIATGLIGSEVQLTERRDSTHGINFKVLVSRSHSAEKTTTTKTADLLPEVIADALYDAIKERVSDLGNDRSRFVAGSQGAHQSGTPIMVLNCQLILEGKEAFAQLAGEDCVCYRLRTGEFYIQAYCPRNSESHLDNLVGHPIEVAGLLRYTSTYPVPGAFSLNLGLKICAIWFR
jgi:hypothetical protein